MIGMVAQFWRLAIISGTLIRRKESEVLAKAARQMFTVEECGDG
jgi:hypothetical protein